MPPAWPLSGRDPLRSCVDNEAIGELLGPITRHFPLMTATPPNGKEGDLQVWLSRLDRDRF